MVRGAAGRGCRRAKQIRLCGGVVLSIVAQRNETVCLDQVLHSRSRGMSSGRLSLTARETLVLPSGQGRPLASDLRLLVGTPENVLGGMMERFSERVAINDNDHIACGAQVRSVDESKEA